LLIALDIDISGRIDGGTLLVAVATLVLAAVTVRLASSTAESVRAAQASADAERLSIEAMAMPYVVIVPQGHDSHILGLESGSPDGLKLSLHVRLLNIGSGPAIVSEVRLDGDEAFVNFTPEQLPLAAGDGKNLALSLRAWPETIGAQLRVRYRHANGRGYVTVQDVRVLDEGKGLHTFGIVRKLYDSPPTGTFSFGTPEDQWRESDAPI
jgi:hypothetical protein